MGWLKVVVTRVKGRAKGDEVAHLPTTTDNKGPVSPHSSGRSAALEVIPAEIWDTILSFLSKTELLSTLKTCQLLRTYAESVLYRQINMKEPATTSQHKLGCLARTIIERPNIALQVRLFEFISTLGSLQGGAKGCSSVEISVYLGVPLPGVGYGTNPSSPGKTITWFDVAALLVLHMPNLVDLRVGTSVLRRMAVEYHTQSSDSKEEDIQHQDLVSQTQQSYPFHRLRSLEITKERSGTIRLPEWQDEEIEQANKLLSLPTMRKYKGMLPAALISSMVESRRHGKSYALTEISCDVYDNAPLGDLLPLMPKLQIFEYTHSWHEAAPYFRCEALYEALNSVTDSLQSLTITGKSYGRWGDVGFKYYYTSTTAVIEKFGPMQKFRLLKYIELPWVLLTERNRALGEEDEAGDGGATVKRERRHFGLKDILPQSLEVLVINDFLAYYVGSGPAICASRDSLLAGFLKDWKSHTPNLKAIRVKGSFDYWPGANISYLKDVCMTAGVDIRFLKW